MYNNAARAYFQTSVNTTSKEDLVVMLYEAAIKFLGQAKDKIKEKDFAKKGILISQSLDIIGELDATLNINKGGEIAKNLHNLYMYCSRRLLVANMRMDIEILDEIIGILSQLKSAFDEILPKVKQSKRIGQMPTAYR